MSTVATNTAARVANKKQKGLHSQVKKTFFMTEFPGIRSALNAKLGIETNLDIVKFNMKDLNVREMCVACVYLLHNLAKDPTGPLPNIDNLLEYDLMKFVYSDTLRPYAEYLMASGSTTAEGKRGRKKASVTVIGPGINPDEVITPTQRRKTTTENAEMFDYMTTLIRYLFILQAKGVRREVKVA